MQKTALAVVEDTATASTETLTLAEKLILVLNSVIATYGHVAINVTRRRSEQCIPHKIKTLTAFDEGTAYQGPHGLWFFDIQKTLYSPQVGETPFNEWIERTYSRIGGPGITQPVGEFTRWN